MNGSFFVWSQKGIDQIQADGRFEKYGRPVLGSSMAHDIAVDLNMNMVDFALVKKVSYLWAQKGVDLAIKKWPDKYEAYGRPIAGTQIEPNGDNLLMNDIVYGNIDRKVVCLT